MKKILLVEDNISIVKGLEYAIKEAGYDLVSKNNYQDAILEINNNYDLIILDITLPDGNGILLSEQVKDTPIVFLTANDDEDTIVKCLERSEDYITKPFRVKELIMRIEKIFKRNYRDKTIIRDVCIDFDKMQVSKKDEVINLTSLEFELLSILVKNKNTVIKREVLLNVWDRENNFVEDNTLTVYIKRIRNKVGKDIIKTIKNVGYIVED